MSRLTWPLHKAGIREDAVRADCALIVPGPDSPRLELWVADQAPRPFIRAVYVGEGDGYNWTEKEELYLLLSDLPADLRSQVHKALSEKLIPEHDAQQKKKYGL